jgi:hypothetical protein
MKHLLFLTLICFTLGSSAYAAIVKSYDNENGCDLYKVIPNVPKVKIKLKTGEILIYEKEVYGISLENMDINFDDREVHVQAMISIVFGLNRPMLPKKVTLFPEHPQFNYLLNHFNKTLSLFEKVCIGDNKIVYARMFEPKNP